ncbi:MAG: histidine phosphatase family protein [Dehalococcoidia bacterium]|nr:MAG: histidine phosphatase family protein [Dehalococcoidia bacterium]
MTRIIVVRHGQTAWNEGQGERFRGRAEVELDDKGIKQAGATAARLAQWEAAAIYSSPLKRALSTANILAEPLKLQVQPTEGLIDIDYGRWQGLSLKEAAEDDSKLYKLWLKSPHLVTFPQGESLEKVQKRVVSAVESLVPQHPGQSIVLVSHKVVCKVLFCSLLGLDTSHFWELQQDPCAINLVEVGENAVAIVSLNDNCHLKELK